MAETAAAPSTALVRLLRANGTLYQPVGAGFLASPRHILTCAHVVNDACGLPLEAAERERRGRIEAHLWRHERLQPVYEMMARLQPALLPIEQEFIRPEAERLLEEIDDPATPHQRRAIIGDRLADIGDPRPGVWLPVPGGEITLENNAGTFTVEPFAISKYPVTWAQYRNFLVAADGYRNEHWWRGLAERVSSPGEQYRRHDNRPADNVSWYDAVAFCRWLSARLEYEVRLPTEWEWQQAATGGNAASGYPWGDDWYSEYANTLESGLGYTTAVGLYPHGASPVGALDMSGNVWEWCLNEPDNPQRTNLSGKAPRVVRGGSWLINRVIARTSCRDRALPDGRNDNLGLRVMRSAPSAS